MCLGDSDIKLCFLDETPGPASYFIKQPARPDAKRAAAFSMGIRIKTKSGMLKISFVRYIFESIF